MPEVVNENRDGFILVDIDPFENLKPISHKDFNEFIKGKGFKGRNNYKMKDLKAMFGFKPLKYGNQTAVSIDDGKEVRDFEF